MLPDQMVTTLNVENSIGGNVISGCPKGKVILPLILNILRNGLLYGMEGPDCKLVGYANDVMIFFGDMDTQI